MAQRQGSGEAEQTAFSPLPPVNFRFALAEICKTLYNKFITNNKKEFIMGNITIRDIALQAGVSKSTASRVINNVGTVSEELRDRVNAVIERVGYQPSAIAQGLSRQDSTLIGVLVPTVSDSFFGQILQGIIETTSQKNYTIVLCTHDNDPECEKRALRALRSQRIKGLLITPAAGYIKREDKNYLRTELEILDVPTVLIDRGIKMSSWDGVYYDNYNGAYLAIETIVKNGFRSIGCMVSDMALQIGKDRMRGVQQAIADFGLTLDQNVFFRDDSAAYLDKSYRVARQWIEADNLPEAMFFSNGTLANGFIKASLEAELRVGKDVYCIGFDHVDILEMIHLEYDYLERDAVNMGRIATNMLMDHFGQSIPTRREYIIPANLHLS